MAFVDLAEFLVFRADATAISAISFASSRRIREGLATLGVGNGAPRGRADILSLTYIMLADRNWVQGRERCHAASLPS